jgi:hypothetical protein
MFSGEIVDLLEFFKIIPMRSNSKKANPSKNRRSFIRSNGLVSASFIFTPPAIMVNGARTTGFQETLALNGGPKAVTASHEDSETWPRYGAEEEKAVLQVLRNADDYSPNDAYEEAWRKRFNVPFCTSHMNGTSAITAMFFALNLPEGSEIMVPCSTFWATITPMRFFGLVPVFVDINPVQEILTSRMRKRK